MAHDAPRSAQRRAALVALAFPAALVLASVGWAALPGCSFLLDSEAACPGVVGQVLVLALLAPTIAISVGNGTGVGFAVGLTVGVTAQLVLWPVIGRWLAGLVVRMDGAFSWQRWTSQYALLIVAYVLTAFVLWVGIGFLSAGW